MTVNTNYASDKSRYYQLASSDGNATPQQNGLQSLLTNTKKLVDTSSSKETATPANNLSYYLNLSSDAQQVLAGTLSSGSTSQSSNTAYSQQHFAISHEQESKIEDIITNYKDAPFTQETFDKIQDDLKHAGLSPDILAAKAQVQNFNATNTFLDILDGQDSSNSILNQQTKGLDLSKYDAHKENYIQDIAAWWQDISTTAKASSETKTSAKSDTTSSGKSST